MGPTCFIYWIMFHIKNLFCDLQAFLLVLVMNQEFKCLNWYEFTPALG